MHQDTLGYLQKRIDILEREIATCDDSVKEHLDSIESIKKEAARTRMIITDLRMMLSTGSEVLT